MTRYGVKNEMSNSFLDCNFLTVLSTGQYSWHSAASIAIFSFQKEYNAEWAFLLIISRCNPLIPINFLWVTVF